MEVGRRVRVVIGPGLDVGYPIVSPNLQFQILLILRLLLWVGVATAAS